MLTSVQVPEGVIWKTSSANGDKNVVKIMLFPFHLGTENLVYIIVYQNQMYAVSGCIKPTFGKSVLNGKDIFTI